MTTARIEVLDDLEALHHVAASYIGTAAADAVRARGRFRFALSGGETPRGLYELLARAVTRLLPWSETELFFGDERCVPPTDPASNYRLARESLLAGPGVPARVHRIEGERGAREAAARYDETLRAALDPVDGGGAWRSFDVALLGIGADGHVASLFPGSPALGERERLAVAAEAPEGSPVRERVSVTLPVIDASRLVVVLAAGAAKRDAVRRALEGDPGLPASRLAAERVVWLLDRAASPVVTADRAPNRPGAS